MSTIATRLEVATTTLEAQVPLLTVAVSTCTTKASEASASQAASASSQTAAAGSAAAALVSQNAASASQIAAASSQTAAAGSAAAALVSQNAASASQSSATASQSAASASQIAAASSQTAAAGSAAAALVSQNAAAASAVSAASFAGAGTGAFSNTALTGVNSVTAPASTDLTLAGGTSGASLVLGSGAGSATFNRALSAVGSVSITGSGATLNLGTETTTGTRRIQFGSTFNSGSLAFQNGATVVATIAPTGVTSNVGFRQGVGSGPTYVDYGWSSASGLYSPTANNISIANNNARVANFSTTALNLDYTTPSTPPSSGALVVGNGTSGGLGVGGAIYANGIISAGNTVYGKASGQGQASTMDPGFYQDTASNVTTQLFGFGNGSRGGVIRGFQNGGNTLVWDFGGIVSSAYTGHMALTAQANSVTSGALNILLTTPSTSATTGALIVGGGVGIAGGNLNTNGQAALSVAPTITPINGNIYGLKMDVSTLSGASFGNVNPVSVSSTNTGTTNAADTTVFQSVVNQSATSGNITNVINYRAANALLNASNVSNIYGFRFADTYASSTGVVGNQYAFYADAMTRGTVNNYAFYAAGAGKVYVGDTTPSTNTTSGALVVTGGVGVGGAMNVGGAATFAGAVTVNGTANLGVSPTLVPLSVDFSGASIGGYARLGPFPAANLDRALIVSGSRNSSGFGDVFLGRNLIPVPSADTMKTLTSTGYNGLIFRGASGTTDFVGAGTSTAGAAITPAVLFSLNNSTGAATFAGAVTATGPGFVSSGNGEIALIAQNSSNIGRIQFKKTAATAQTWQLGTSGNDLTSLAFNIDDAMTGATRMKIAATTGDITFGTGAATFGGAVTAPSLTAPAALTLAGGSTGASLVLGQGGNGVATLSGASSGASIVASQGGTDTIFLTPSGSTSASQVRVPAGAAARPIFGPQAGSGIFFPGGGATGFSVGSVEAVRVSGNLNLLIGTTTDATSLSGGLVINGSGAGATSSSTSTGALRVTGGVGIGGALYGTTINMSGLATFGADVVIAAGNVFKSTGDAYFQSAPTTSVYLRPGGTTALTLAPTTLAATFAGAVTTGANIVASSSGTNSLQSLTSATNAYSGLILANSGASGRSFLLATGGSAFADASFQSSFVIYDATLGATRLKINASGDTSITSTTPSTLTTNGALVVTGGVGVGGAGYFGGALIAQGDGTFNSVRTSTGGNSSAYVANPTFGTAPSGTDPSYQMGLKFGTTGAAQFWRYTGTHQTADLTWATTGLFTFSKALAVTDTTPASSSIVGALTIGNGTAATNVAIGGGAINAGGNIRGAALEVPANGTITNVSNGGYIQFVSDGSILLRSQGGGANQVTIPQAGGITTTGVISSTLATSSSGLGTGALQVAGGAYFGAASVFGSGSSTNPLSVNFGNGANSGYALFSTNPSSLPGRGIVIGQMRTLNYDDAMVAKNLVAVPGADTGKTLHSSAYAGMIYRWDGNIDWVSNSTSTAGAAITPTVRMGLDTSGNLSVTGKATVSAALASSGVGTGALQVTNGGIYAGAASYFGGQVNIAASGANGLIVRPASGNSLAIFDASAGGADANAYISLQTSGTNRWVFGQSISTAAGDFEIYSTPLGASALKLAKATGAATFAGAVNAGGVVINGTTTLPAAGNVNWHLYSAGAEKKMLIGDGSGYSLALTKRTGSVSTDVITFTDSGAATFAGTISPQQATTAGAPAYVKGAIYFDTTLNKLRVGGATAWETITSA